MVPAVSILTPTFNHAAFIRECLDSVLAQSFESWELLVLDDGSLDETGAIVQSYGDPRIRYVQQAHRGLDGLVDSYNRGLSMCRAPLVAILEGDDYWPSDKLERLVPAFQDPEIVLAYGVTRVVGGERHGLLPTTPHPRMEQDFPRGTLTNSPVGSAALAMFDFRVLTFTYPCSVVLRRSTLDHIGGFQRLEGVPITDYPTFFRLALEGRFHFEPAVMGYWRVHSSGTTINRLHLMLPALGRGVRRYMAEHGARLGLTAAQRRELELAWTLGLAQMSLRKGRKLLVERRWREARPALFEAAQKGRRRTRLMAVLGLLGSVVRTTVEPFYRFRGRPWFRAVANGESEWVT